MAMVIGRSKTFSVARNAVRAFQDPKTGVNCVQRDNNPTMASHTFMASTEIKGEPVTIILSHVYSGDHSKVLRLCDFRLASFKRHLHQLANGININSVMSLYSNVEKELREHVTRDMPEREAYCKTLDIDPEIDIDPDPISTVKENDWLPHLYTTLVAIYESGKVAVGGPGAMSVAVAGQRSLKEFSSSCESYATLQWGHLNRDEVLLISDIFSRVQTSWNAGELEIDNISTTAEEADLGTLAIVVIFV
ncbi:uncharacterized protein LOC9628781 [Selaginella moellendorffii]|uniref:uncharacterized protein LOC9628781 n=1 Tax=Selaginella moellendorffii TaxID=88036 RepID=UPI000D1C93A9|nr:uncharacterized protein LOC9628781 [Selaginella moellendorffii]|eukprot:XP_024535591.1 uncharacterized protein LOC9628781 [Selaginella moellendorffii]